MLKTYAKAGCDGAYTLPAIDGAWSVTSNVSQLAAIYRSLDQTTVERNVTVSGADVEGMNFVVGRWLFKPAITGVAAMAPEGLLDHYDDLDGVLAGLARGA